MKLKVVNIIIVLAILVVLGIGIFLIFNIKYSENPIIDINPKTTYYVASPMSTAPLYNLQLSETMTLPRGTEIIVSTDKENINGSDYYKINYQNNDYYILTSNLTEQKEQVVLEKALYVRTTATLYETASSFEILGMVNKGDMLEITDYTPVLEDGSVLMYKVKANNQEGFIYSKYLVSTLEEAVANYDEAGSYQIHAKRTNSWLLGGGADKLDYYPREKGSFENNTMPEDVRSYYLPSTVLNNIDAYINLAKESGINTFVIDIKDSTVPAYPAKAFEKYSPTNYSKAINSYENYKNVIQKLKNEGFYVVGRISVFKDSYYAQDHPENTIIDNNTGTSFVYNSSKWPTAFSRHVWEFNVALAIESVTEIGFNEIQFDYVRFPDGTISKENSGQLNFNNVYNEDKSQAIQRFLMYATDELHKVNAYVSADVFGEAANSYVTAYGQYWPAISNVVDVISAMPYPDHFNKYEYGFKVPVWTIPYELLKMWGTGAMTRQGEIPTPAKARTWIQAYNAYREPYITYDSHMVSEQLRALYEVGLDDGFMPWNASGSVSKYESLKEAFGKEY